MSERTHETAKELGGRIGMSVSNIYRLVRLKRLPAVRIGDRGRLLFPRAEVDAALKQAR